MPHISFRDMGNIVHQATLAVNERFDSIEPAIFNSGECGVEVHGRSIQLDVNLNDQLLFLSGGFPEVTLFLTVSNFFTRNV